MAHRLKHTCITGEPQLMNATPASMKRSRILKSGCEAKAVGIDEIASAVPDIRELMDRDIVMSRSNQSSPVTVSRVSRWSPGENKSISTKPLDCYADNQQDGCDKDDSI
jgi:hypothetical protein